MNPFEERGVPLENQIRTWKEVAQPPFRKQEVDAFTRCRVILMNGVENEASIFSHSFARVCPDRETKELLARMRMVEHQQQNTINWLNPPDQSPLETTIAFEQVAIELTAYLSRQEPDEYVKMAFDFGLLEDFDHLYRYGQMLDLVHGKDPNEILQGRTDVFPGRPTQDHHNDPALRVLQHYDKENASPITKSHVLTLMAGEQQTWNYYRTIGNYYGTPELRQLYAEISAVEEEHVSQYESLMDPNETWLERLVMHEFNEVANYYTCYMTEVDPRIKQIWEQFLGYELEHLRLAGELLKKHENRDPQEICGVDLPTPATFESNREFVADVLEKTVKLRLVPDGQWKDISDLPKNWSSYAWQKAMNGDNAPSEAVVATRILSAGAELVRTGVPRLEGAAGQYRTEPLDKGEVPNTVPANGQFATMDEEKMRLGELADEIENYTVASNGKSKETARQKAGQGAESAARSPRAK